MWEKNSSYHTKTTESRTAVLSVYDYQRESGSSNGCLSLFSRTLTHKTHTHYHT